MRTTSRFLLAAALLSFPGAAALAGGMSAQEMTDARAKVQTGVALASIARETKDGDAMLVAARLLASAGPVAMGEPGADGSTKLYDVKAMASEAKAMGADAAKADMMMTTATANTSNAKPTGQWVNTCDASGYCAWSYWD